MNADEMKPKDLREHLRNGGTLESHGWQGNPDAKRRVVAATPASGEEMYLILHDYPGVDQKQPMPAEGIGALYALMGQMGTPLEEWVVPENA